MWVGSGPDEQEVELVPDRNTPVGFFDFNQLCSEAVRSVFSVAIKQCHRAIPNPQRKVIGAIEGVAVKLIGASGS